MNTRHRIAELRGFMEEKGITLSVVTSPDNQFYISGFRAVIYSRPIDLVLSHDKTTLIVPGLEEVHAQAEAAADEIKVYYEHPEKAGLGKTHLDHLNKIVRQLPKGAKVGVEVGAAPYGLVEHLKAEGLEPVDVGRKIVEMRFIKDASEVDLMVEAGRLVSLAVRSSLEGLREGVTEMEVDSKGNAALFKEVAARQPEATLDYFVMTPSGSARSAMPHVFSNTRPLHAGDVLIHSRQVALNGYRGECERTCFLGRPGPEQERAFKVAQEAQQAAVESIKPGITMREVDSAARRIIQGAGFGEYAIHRTGHGMGISSHEEPYVRFDEEMIVREGMALSIEPGFYVPGLGGFRHSDTVVLTREGLRMTTNYPRDLESLIF